MNLFLFLSGISLGQYCWKSLAKSIGFRKKYKKGDSHIGGLSTEGGFKPSTQYVLRGRKAETFGALKYWGT